MLLLRTLAATVLAGFLASARTDPGNANAAPNVNSRYTVERVDVTPMGLDKISAPVRERLQQLVGAPFNSSILEDAAGRLKRELRNREVTTQVTRGSAPDRVAVTFHVELRNREFDAQVTELLYHSKEQFNYGLDLGYRVGANRFRAGGMTANDDLVERQSGIRGGAEHAFGAGWMRLGVDASVWRSTWNAATGAALMNTPSLETSGTYRQRAQVQPGATFELLKPLTLQLGVSFERLEMNAPAARHEISSAAFGTLRFQRRWGLSSETRQRFEAAYGFRAGTPSLASDFSFTRHHWMARYGLRRGQQEILTAFQAGLINGRAPLDERFIAGNSRILRGWNRYDLAPAGASRLAHASFDYRWRKLRLAYDAGTLRSTAVSADGGLRQSVGIGVSSNLWSGLSFLVAFPLREGRVEPIFIAGMNF